MSDLSNCCRCGQDKDRRKFIQLASGQPQKWCIACAKKPGRPRKPATDAAKARAMDKARKADATGEPCEACDRGGALGVSWRGAAGDLVTVGLCVGCRKMARLAYARPERLRALADVLEAKGGDPATEPTTDERDPLA